MSSDFEQEGRIVPVLDIDQLRVIAPLGRGAKGVVFLVEDTQSSELWALKVILRDLIKKKKKNNDKNSQNDHYKRIWFERNVLNRFRHPLLPRLYGLLSTDRVVGYAIDYCPGKDLHWLRKQQSEKMFSDDIIRFYAGELVLALEYLHKQGIVYRDLKPDNIMVQENGHVMLVDFDLSAKLSPIKSPTTRNGFKASPDSVLPTKKRTSFPKSRLLSRSLKFFCHSGIVSNDGKEHWEESGSYSGDSYDHDSGEKSNSFVGTEEYVAPEIIHGKGHDFAVDYWSLGIVLYEMLYGFTPFKGVNRKETFYRILTKEPELIGEQTALRDLIRNLLIKDPIERIGVDQIKAHEFFRGVNWELLVTVSRPPYIPLNENEDQSEKRSVNEDGNNESSRGIDVEAFVEGIFVDKNKVEQVDGDGTRKSENIENSIINNGVWVNGLDNPPCDAENFVVF